MVTSARGGSHNIGVGGGRYSFGYKIDSNVYHTGKIVNIFNDYKQKVTFKNHIQFKK